MQIYEYTKSVYMHTYIQILCMRLRLYIYSIYIYMWHHNLFSLLLKLPQLIKIGMDWQFRFFGGLQLRFLIVVIENQ